MPKTDYINIHIGDIMAEVLRIKYEGYRLVQICATRTKEGFELIYSFGKEYDLLCLRVPLKEGESVTSISHVFEPAFLYENEIHDLFGIPIQLMTVDYHGNFYRTKQKAPFKQEGN